MIKIKNKIRTLCNKHHTAVIIFVFELLYQFVVTNAFRLWKVDEITYAYHAVDFSMGFCSKILPGAIYGAIFRKHSYALISLWETILFLIFAAIISVLLEKLYKSYDGTDNSFIKLFIFLAITGPFTLSIFIVEFGMLDVYWFYFTIIVICLLSRKKLVLFSLPFAFLIVSVHYSSMLCYIPLIVLLMLYKSTASNDKYEKRVYFISSFLFAAIAFLSAIYFVLFDSSNLTLSMKEFNDILSSKGADYHTYYDYVFYRETAGYGFEYSEISNSSNQIYSNFINTLVQQIRINFSLIKLNSGFFGMIFTVPIVVAVISYFISIIKDKNEKYDKKLVLILMSMMFLVTLFGGCVFSTDIVRWYSHGFICLLISLFFVIYCNSKTSNNSACLLNGFIEKIPKPIVESYCLLYSLMIFEIYS